MTEKSEDVRWDVQFFFKTPTHFPLLSGDALRIATITKSGWSRIIELQEKLTSLKHFLENIERQYVLICSIRTSAATAHKAIFKAHRLLATYIDSLAVAGFCIPAVSPVIVVREGNEPDAQVMEFYRDKWLEGRPSTTAERESWTARSDEIMQHLLPVLSQLIEKSPDDRNEIAWRALHSAKLFRRGIESRNFGMEFFCKFAALENLVAGGEILKKGEKIRSRLTDLVGDVLPDTESSVTELWNRRHPLVHEARLEFIDEDPQAFPVHIYMETLNWLFQVTFVFLSDHFGSATSLDELWKCAGQYRVPAKVRDTRPKEIARFPASTWSEKCGIVWNGGGKLIDDLWAAPLSNESRPSV
jgi:hypothetical protein